MTNVPTRSLQLLAAVWGSAVWTVLLASSMVTAAQLNVKNECTGPVYVSSTSDGFISASVPAGKTSNLTSSIFDGWVGNIDFATGCDASGNVCTTGGGTFNGTTPFTSVFVDYTQETGVALLYSFDLSAGFNIGLQISTSKASCPAISCDNFKTGCPASGPSGSCYGACCDSVSSCSADGGLQTCGGFISPTPDPKTQIYYDAQCPDATSNTNWNCSSTDLTLTLCPGVTSDFVNGNAVLAASSSASAPTASKTGTSASRTKGAASSATGTDSSATTTGGPSATANTSTSNDLATTKTSNVGAIAGAIVGVLLLLLLLLGVWLLLRRRRQAKQQRDRAAAADILAEDFTPYSMSSSSASVPATLQSSYKGSRDRLVPGDGAAAPTRSVPHKSPLVIPSSRQRQAVGGAGMEKRPVEAEPLDSAGPSASTSSAAPTPSRSASASASTTSPSSSQDATSPASAEVVEQTEEQLQLQQEMDVLRQLVHIQGAQLSRLGRGPGQRVSVSESEAPPEYDGD